MELWFIYALLSMVISGLVTFTQKYCVQQKLSAVHITLGIQMGQFACAGLMWTFFDRSLVSWEGILLLSLATGVIYMLVHYLRSRSLEYIDTTIFFPLSKFIGPTAVALIGILYIGEKASIFEIIGIAVGATIPLLLIDNLESSRQVNLKKGIILMLIGTSLSVIGIFITRLVAVGDGSIWLYLMTQGMIGSLSAYCLLKYGKKEKNLETFRKALVIGGATGVGLAWGIFLLMKSFETGLISVAYTINSFYILIPIVLSVLIYKEHMSMRKALAIGLSIVAIIFFQI